MIASAQSLRTLNDQRFGQMTLTKLDRHSFWDFTAELLDRLGKRLCEKTANAKVASIQFDDWSDRANRSFTGIHDGVMLDDASGRGAKPLSFTLANVPHDALMAPNGENLADVIYAETTKQP
jgi:hypothetical protein